MNTDICQLVGNEKDIQRGEEARNLLLPILCARCAPDGALFLRNGDLRRAAINRVKSCNSAKLWAQQANYIKSRIIEDDDENDRLNALDYLVNVFFKYAKNEDPRYWTKEAIDARENEKAARNAAASGIAEFIGLPPLSGSEKQVAWAITLRDTARQLAETLRATDEFKALAKSSEGKTAKFWIENRDEVQLCEIFGWIPADDTGVFMHEARYHSDEIAYRKMTTAEREESKKTMKAAATTKATASRKRFAKKRYY